MTAGVYPSFRYFRWVNVEAQGTDYLDFSELALYRNGSRITGGTYSTSAGFNQSLPISNLGDGVVNARVGYWWQTSWRGVPGFFIKVDFGSAKEVDSWRQAVSDTLGRGIASCKVQGSNDDVSWTDINTFTGLTNPTLWVLGSVNTLGTAPAVVFPPNVNVGTVGVLPDAAYVCTVSGNPGTWLKVS